MAGNDWLLTPADRGMRGDEQQPPAAEPAGEKKRGRVEEDAAKGHAFCGAGALAGAGVSPLQEGATR